MLGSILGLEDIADKLSGKKVIMRVDFNVPFDKDLQISDKSRILATLPSIEFILSKNVQSLILMSHCGRPDGQIVTKFSLKPVAVELSKLLDKNVQFLDDCVGQNVENVCKNAQNGQIILLENLRFHVEEEGKGVDKDGKKVTASKEAIEKFSDSLSKLGEIYVNDAFGTAHRAHTSMVGVNCGIKVGGFLMKKELQFFSATLEVPKRPFLAILGGAKVKDKIKLIHNMIDKVDMMILGGGLAFTFLHTLTGMGIGSSLFEGEMGETVKNVMEKAHQKNVQIALPEDFVCGDKFDNSAHTIQISKGQDIPQGYLGLDCGPQTCQTAKEMIMKAKTIVWNGAQGVFEMPKFANGSLAFVEYVAESTKNGCLSIAGGGETLALIEMAGQTKNFSHVSTGGGASLELLEGKVLPGVAALNKKGDI